MCEEMRYVCYDYLIYPLQYRLVLNNDCYELYPLGISVDFSLNSVDLTVTEGEMINFIVIAFGFSYDFFPVQLTVLPCSGYPGDLSALFDNIPQDSASPSMYLFISLYMIVVR